MDFKKHHRYQEFLRYLAATKQDRLFVEFTPAAKEFAFEKYLEEKDDGQKEGLLRGSLRNRDSVAEY